MWEAPTPELILTPVSPSGTSFKLPTEFSPVTPTGPGGVGDGDGGENGDGGGGGHGKREWKEPSNKESAMAILKSNYLNVLIIFVPISWALHFAKVGDTAVFLTSFFGIIPLASLLGFGTEELTMRVGPTIGGLVNATLGNVVELIVAILALVKCELRIVQSSLLGSILSNILLVLGCCLFLGGARFSELYFKVGAAQLNGTILFMAVTSVLIPFGFHAAFDASIMDETEKPDLLKISRGTSIILILIYFGYLLSQLKTHKFLYDEERPGESFRPPEEGYKVKMFKNIYLMRSVASNIDQINREAKRSDEMVKVEEEEEEQPQLNKLFIALLLTSVAGLVGLTSEFLVDSINGFAEKGGISQEFVGLIMLPIVGNAAEHWSAITAAWKGRMDLSMGIAIGSGIQISVFVIPLLVVIGWVIGKPLSLLFDPFEALSLFLGVLVTTQVIQAGRTTFLSGWCLLAIYTLIALAVWFYPQTAAANLALDFFTCS
ncbi:calcium/proton exchanger [Atractiella rhizophila]|nr:calcium/proton exchanger [Atractiella rhizophila]